MNMISNTTHTNKISLTPQDLNHLLVQTTRSGGFMNFTPAEGATISAEVLPDGGAEIVVINNEGDILTER